MKRKLLLVLALASATALAADHGGHWGYAGPSAPEHWGDLEAGYATCKLGGLQSPIDIRDAAPAALPPIAFAYRTSAAEVVNNGHTVQVNLADAGSAGLESGRYKLLQFHFHTPSEEMVDGAHYPLVAHFVHQDADGRLAVVAVLFKEGKENAALAPVFAAMPAEAGAKAALPDLDPGTLLPASRAYYAFMGSLTTPPCSEGVFWQVLSAPVEVSAAQLAAFRRLYPMNARPVQPGNGREVRVGG